MEWFLGIWVFVVGSCIASFLNVVAYRLPAGLPITGVSFCPYCRVPIRPSDNVPVFGWLLLGGRCRACKLRISPRYPIFELIGGLLMLTIFFSTILGHGDNLAWQNTSDLPYGIPVNLHFMNESVFYVAGLHAWLLFFLYAGALTSFGGGQLPKYVWIFGGVGVLVFTALCPEVCILPLGDSDLAFATTLIPDTPWLRAILTSALGGFVALFLALLGRRDADRSSWTAACFLIGLTLGWQAIILILAISTIGSWLEKTLARTDEYPLNRIPMRMLWFWTAIFLMTWRWLPRFPDIL